ncbi:MAG: multidrug transporter [Deltaproteobacteria bacterium HGW-Deltaproteobacteria-17]|nr:MAG: multidrug transporter [Deltaproteobacteria bacterium HGW-Deltaproteobacteria-17]
MNPSVSRFDTFSLIVLAGIWGGSFIFMRIAAPVLGPIWTADLRVGIAGLVLWAVFLVRGASLGWREHGRHYLILGFVNSALPFLLYAFAAQHIPASYSVILNATSPLFGAVLAILFLKDRLTAMKWIGLGLGALGVALVTDLGATATGAMFWLSIGACLLAAACYAVGATYLKLRASHLNPAAISTASLLCAGLILAPGLPLVPPKAPVTGLVIASVAALAVVCSALAYLIYYRLIARIGPTRALTVTFLMPVFGMLWGFLFLREQITLKMIAGAGLVLLSLRFVLSTADGRR